MKTEILTVTPEMASMMLLGNRDNRKVKQTVVDYLANEIKLGRWQLTHQGVAISETGRLLDGQHRLLAIVKSGIPCKMMVTTGAHDETFMVLDSGVKRNLSDHTGLNKRTSETLTLAVYIQRNRAGRVSPSDILELRNTPFGDDVAYVCDGVKVNRRYFSTVGAKLAAAVLFSNNKNPQALNELNNIIGMDFDRMNDVQKAIFKKVTNQGGFKAFGAYSKGAQVDAFTMMHYALNPENSNNTRIMCSDAYQKMAVFELKAAINKGNM
jgi:hypothetical protein